VACRRDPDAPPPCGAVAAKFLAIAKADLDKSAVDDATRRAVLDQLPAIRDSLANVCSDSAWSGAVRRCLADASDHLGFETCQQQLTEDQRRALDRSARGATDSR
jgi:hypothetical protein